MAKPMESGEMLVASDAFSFPSLRVTGQPNQEAQSDRISDEVLLGWVSESAPLRTVPLLLLTLTFL